MSQCRCGIEHPPTPPAPSFVSDILADLQALGMIAACLTVTWAAAFVVAAIIERIIP